MQLVGSGQHTGGVQRGRGYIGTQPTVGHVVIQIVAVLNCHIAVSGESNGQLAVDKLILTQIGVILLTGIIGTVDVADQVVIGTDGNIVGISSAANRALAVHKAVGGGNGSRLQLEHGAGFYLAGVGRSDRGSTPIGEISPAFIDILLCVFGVDLLIDGGYKPPVGIGAIAAGGFVAHVAGIAGIVAGVGGAVVCVEGGVAAGAGGDGIIGIGIAPVVVQIAALGVGLHNGLCGGGFGSGDLGTGFVVLGVQTVGSGEAGGPGRYILDTAVTGLNPLAALLGVAGQRSCGGSSGLIVSVAVLGLGREQIAVQTGNRQLDPLAGHLVSGVGSGNAAAGTGEDVFVIGAAGAAAHFVGVLMTGGRNGFLRCDHNATLGAVSAVGHTCGGTACSITGISNKIVAADQVGRGRNGCAANGEGSGPDNHIFGLILQSATGDVVVSDICGELIGVVTGAETAERQLAVNSAFCQLVGFGVTGVAAADDRSHLSVFTGVDLGIGCVDVIVLGNHLSGDGIGSAGIQLACHGGRQYGNIVVKVGDRCHIVGIHITVGAVVVDLIPVTAGAVFVQCGNLHGGAGGEGSDGGIAGTGPLTHIHIAGGLTGEVGGIGGTLCKISGITGSVGGGVDAGEVGIAHIAVNITGNAGNAAFPGVLPDPGTTVVGSRTVGAEAVDLGDPNRHGVQIGIDVGIAEPAGKAVEAGFTAALPDGVAESGTDRFFGGGTQGSLGTVFHVEPDAHIRLVAISVQGIQNPLGFRSSSRSAQRIGVVVHTVGNAVLFTACGILQKTIVQRGGEADTQNGEVNIVLHLGPIHRALPGGNVNAEGGGLIGVSPVGDHTLLALHDHALVGGGKGAVTVNVVAERFNGNDEVVDTGRSLTERQAGIQSALVKTVAFGVDICAGKNGRCIRQVLVGIHTCGDLADQVFGGGDFTFDAEGVTHSQRGGSHDIFDADVTGQMVQHRAVCSVYIHGHVVKENLVVVSTGGVFVQSLNGQHRVGRHCVFGRTGVVGFCFQRSGCFGLDTEVGGIAGGDVVRGCGISRKTQRCAGQHQNQCQCQGQETLHSFHVRSCICAFVEIHKYAPFFW